MLSKPRILFCSDFSEYSREALKAAGKIMAVTNGVLHALHVSEHLLTWDWIPAAGIPNPLNEKMEIDLINSLQKRLETQLSECGIEGECYISFGIASSAIIQHVLEKKIDLVVIAHKGKSASTFLVGGLAEKIVASCPVPLFVIKIPLKETKVAALVDPNGEAKSIINWAEELSILLSSKLTVVSLLPDVLSKNITLFRKIYYPNAFTLNEEQKKLFTR